MKINANKYKIVTIRPVKAHICAIVRVLLTNEVYRQMNNDETKITLKIQKRDVDCLLQAIYDFKDGRINYLESADGDKDFCDELVAEIQSATRLYNEAVKASKD